MAKPISQDELAKRLEEKYSTMDEKQLQAVMAEKLIQIGKEEEKMRLVTESIKTSTEQLVQYQKILMGLLIGAIVIFIAYIAYKILQVYISFHKFISWVNSAVITPVTWPTGGFGTALSIMYPFMSGWFGFEDPYLPMAAYMSWFQYGDSVLSSTGQTVNDSASIVLAGMYRFAQTGGDVQNSQCGVAYGNDIPSWELICCGWGNANGIADCTGVYCDTSLSTSDYVNMASTSFASGTQGAFAGGMGGGGVASKLIGFWIMSAIQFGISYWQATSQKKANADANGCNGTSSTGDE